MDEDDERSPYPGETAAPVQGPAPEARPPPRPPEGGDAVLEAFNQDVRTWLEIDGSIRSLQVWYQGQKSSPHASASMEQTAG